MAVSQNGIALHFVDNKFINEHLCKIAVDNDPYALWFVPQKYKNYEICSIALKKNKNVLDAVDPDIRTKLICDHFSPN